MKKVKIFTGNRIEIDINNWLSTFTGTIIKTTQSGSYGKTMITIFYEEELLP